MMPQNRFFAMHRAFELAQYAAEQGEVPVGAVIVFEGEIISEATNQMTALNDPTAHAELMALKMALHKLGTGRLEGCDLYVTLEPCTMCAGAIAHAKIRRLYYGAQDEKGGAVDNGVQFFAQKTCHHRPEVISGVMETQCAQLLTSFFAARR